MDIMIDEKSIVLKACFKIKTYNNVQTHSIESFVSNSSNIPNMVTELATA